MRHILTNRAFILLWSAGLLMQLTWWMLHTSMLVLVFERTGSTVGTSLIPVVSSIPGIIFGANAGRLVDRHDRRRLLRIGALLLALLMLAVLPFIADAPAILLYALIFVQSTIMTVMTPAENALLPTLVETPLLRLANALNVLNDGLGRIAGPAIGVLLLDHTGETGMVAACLALFTFASVVLGAMPSRAAVHRAHPDDTLTHASFRGQLALARRIVRARSTLTVAIGAFALYMVADVPFSAVFPVFVVDSLDAGADGLGLMLSLRGVAGIGGSLLIVALSRHVSAPVMLVSGLLTYGASIGIQGIWNQYPEGMLFLILVGPAAAAIQTGLNTLLQESSEDRERGRIFALVGTIGSLVALAMSLLAGGLGEMVGVRAIVVMSGALQILPALLVVRGLLHPDGSRRMLRDA